MDAIIPLDIGLVSLGRLGRFQYRLNDACDVSRIINPAMVRSLERQSEPFKSLGHAHLLDLKRLRKRDLEVQVTGGERPTDAMVVAVHVELLSIVVAPGTKDVIAERVCPHSKPVQRLGKSLGSVDVRLLDGGELSAEGGQVRVSHGLDEGTEVSNNCEGVRCEHDRADLDDFILSTGDEAIVATSRLQIDDEVVALIDGKWLGIHGRKCY